MSLDPGNGGAFVQITIGQVYSEVTGMRQEVRDLTHSVQGAVGQLGDHETRIRTLEHTTASLKDLKDSDDDHEKRLRGLERRVWAAAGLATALSGGSTLVAYLMKAH